MEHAWDVLPGSCWLLLMLVEGVGSTLTAVRVTGLTSVRQLWIETCSLIWPSTVSTENQTEDNFLHCCCCCLMPCPTQSIWNCLVSWRLEHDSSLITLFHLISTLLIPPRVPNGSHTDAGFSWKTLAWHWAGSALWVLSQPNAGKWPMPSCIQRYVLQEFYRVMHLFNEIHLVRIAQAEEKAGFSWVWETLVTLLNLTDLHFDFPSITVLRFGFCLLMENQVSYAEKWSILRRTSTVTLKIYLDEM